MRPLAAFAALLCGAWMATAAAQVCPPTPERDALRQIVQCLDGADCRGRKVVEKENLGPGCDDQIEVWSWHGGRRSVAIRDRKMCLSRRAAAPDMRFVHGLLLPLAPLCGVEDPRLYVEASPWADLWADAWAAARARLPEGEIILVVNPPTLRSLTHLHVHILRSNRVPFPAGEAVALDDLAEVWLRAGQSAALRPSIAGRNYGIAVRRRGAGFEMLVEPGAPFNQRNPEQKYGVDTD